MNNSTARSIRNKDRITRAFDMPQCLTNGVRWNSPSEGMNKTQLISIMNEGAAATPVAARKPVTTIQFKRCDICNLNIAETICNTCRKRGHHEDMGKDTEG